MNLTEDEYILADLMLIKFPYNEERHTLAIFPSIMTGENSKFDSETFNRLAHLANSKPRQVRNFLLEQDYLDCTNMSMPTDKLTEKGKIAKREGGHLKYKEWEKKENKKNQKNWAERHQIIFTILVALLSAILGVLGTLLVEYLKSAHKLGL